MSCKAVLPKSSAEARQMWVEEQLSQKPQQGLSTAHGLLEGRRGRGGRRSGARWDVCLSCDTMREFAVVGALRSYSFSRDGGSSHGREGEWHSQRSEEGRPGEKLWGSQSSVW